MKKFRVFIITIFMFPVACLANEMEILEQQKALVETGDAYIRQGSQIHYDSYRKQLNASPEDATIQHRVYTVCSGITYQIYYQTLGIKIPDTTEELLAYAKDNEGSDYVLDYYGEGEVHSVNALGTANDDSYLELFDRWLEIIEPGDIFVVTGHAMFVEKVDRENEKITLIEAWYPKNYDYINHVDNIDVKNTLSRIDLKSKLDYYRKKSLESMALIRPTKDGNKYLKQSGSLNKYTYEELTYDGLTDSSKSRLKYPKLDIEKTIEVNDGLNQNIVAYKGDKITYTLTITNNSDNVYENIKVVENIDDKLKIVDIGVGLVNNNQIEWEIQSINPQESKTITYTLQVLPYDSLDGKIIISTGKVDNIATSKIETLISSKFNENDIKNLNDTYEKIKYNNSIEREFINDIYKETFNIDLGLNEYKNLDVISYNANITNSGRDTLSIKRTQINDTKISKYILQNFYGLRTFGGVTTTVNANRDCPESSLVRIIGQWNINPKIEFNDRARDIKENMLIDGDIILLSLAYEPMSSSKNSCPVEELEEQSFIYLNNKLIRKVENNIIEEIIGKELEQFLANMVGENYIILRPSIVLRRTAIGDADVEITPPDTPEEEPSDDELQDSDDEEIPKEDNKTDNKEDEPLIENPKTGLISISFLIIILILNIFLFNRIKQRNFIKKI